MPERVATQLPTAELIRLEWLFLTYGALMSFWSSIGQTFFISLFSLEIRTDLSLSHGEFGGYYAIATMFSAITLFWLGKLADKLTVFRLSLITIIALAISALLFSFISGILTLIGGIYLLRLLGQGMMTHVYSVAITRRYKAARGRALAITGVGINIAESIGPPIIVLMISSIGWRQVWLVIPIIFFLSIVPFLSRLTQKTPFQEKSIGRTNNTQKIITETKEFKRKDLSKNIEFWVVILPLIAVPSFTITGILFHQIFLADAKFVTLFNWSKYYVFYAFTAIIGAFLSGFLIDWVSARKSSFIGHSALLVGLICLWLGQGSFALIFFFSFFGLASGMITSSTNALLAEKYGTKWLGEIRAATQPVTVASSAISPILLGVMIDKGFGLTGLMLVLIIISAYPVIAAILNFNLFAREE